MLMETDIYKPLKAYMVQRGYTVRSEVRDCDLTAVKGEQLVIIELKARFNLELVLQGVDRQRICPDVYLAVPRPRNMRGLRWRRILRLCRALGLGLMTVSSRGLVEVLCSPEVHPPRPSSRERSLMLQEIAQRSGDYNIGGSRGRPLVTAYREQALLVAAAIAQGLERPRDIIAATGIAKAPSILQKNHYSWFERVERGVYRLSCQGCQALKDYADVVKSCISSRTSYNTPGAKRH